jgi:hypothetical protein
VNECLDPILTGTRPFHGHRRPHGINSAALHFLHILCMARTGAVRIHDRRDEGALNHPARSTSQIGGDLALLLPVEG